MTLVNRNYLETAKAVIIAKIVSGVVIPVDLVSSAGSPLSIDETTGALVMVDTVHHEIHEGEYFTTSHLNTSVGNGANLDIRILTGPDGMHFASTIDAAGQCTVLLYEDAVISGGTALRVFNNFRGKGDNHAPFAAFHTPTVTSTGVVLVSSLIAGGTSIQTRVGASARTGDELVLHPNRNYLLRINNSSGAAIGIGIIISGYAE